MSSSRELWDSVYGCAKSGAVRPETMLSFFFEALTDVLNEAEAVAKSGDTVTTGHLLRELQAKCERLMSLIEPNDRTQALRIVSSNERSPLLRVVR